MRGEASRVDNGSAYLSESLLYSYAITRFVFNRLMEGEEVQETELE